MTHSMVVTKRAGTEIYLTCHSTNTKNKPISELSRGKKGVYVVRAQGVIMGLVSLIAALLGASCSPSTPAPSGGCGEGPGRQSAQAVVEGLLEAARGDSVDALCELYQTQHDRAEAEQSLQQLKAQIDSSGGFDGLKIVKIEQLGSEHVMGITAGDGKNIRQVSVASDDNATFFLGTLRTEP